MVERMTAKAFNSGKASKRSKYGAKKMVVQGLTFDSKKEADRWLVLRDLERKGDIGGLQRQVRYDLQGRDGPILTDKKTKTRAYVADFQYVDWRLNGAVVIEDVKGFETPEFKLKRSILEAQGITLTIT